jgi:hypothetical protein
MFWVWESTPPKGWDNSINDAQLGQPHNTWRWLIEAETGALGTVMVWCQGQSPKTVEPGVGGWPYTPLAVVSRARKATRINHCYDSANFGYFVKRGRCTQHAKIPSLTSDTYE